MRIAAVSLERPSHGLEMPPGGETSMAVGRRGSYKAADDPSLPIGDGMFKKLAADALGLTDVGAVIPRADYDKVEADDYVMHEDGETIFFLIKSKSDEYCFTNHALIHVDGRTAVSKKRTLRRYGYRANRISDVSLETAGTIDIDVEIKFTIGPQAFSIDVNKRHLEQLKDLYKVLIRISELGEENQTMLDYASQSLQLASATLGRLGGSQGDPAANIRDVNRVAFEWLVESYQQYSTKDFGFVFERYINN